MKTTTIRENRQKLFEQAFKGLYAQGKRSVDPYDTNICMYRSPSGDKCAIGFLIPDEMYKPGMEENTPYGLETEFPELMSFLLKDVEDGDKDISWYLGYIQRCMHDSMPAGLGIDEFRASLISASKQFAKIKDLDESFLDSYVKTSKQD